MTDRTCPLGDDCDLTVAYMAGQESAKDKYKARIEELEAELAEAVQNTLDAASTYMKTQYDIGALSHPVDRMRVLEILKEKTHA